MMAPGRNGAAGPILLWPRMSEPARWSAKTRAILAGRDQGSFGRTVNPPIQRGSSVLFESSSAFSHRPALHYGIQGLATQEALRAALCALTGAETAVLAPSGLSACTLALLSVAEAGHTLLVSDGCYGPTRSFCDGLARRLGVETRYYAPRIGAGIADLLDASVCGVMMESPSSLTFELQDVGAIATAAQRCGVPTMIDDTWSAGVLFRPFEHGVDLSIQALTKHQGGHADLLLGAVLARTPALAARVEAACAQLGLCVAPEDAFLTLRGMRTMGLRLQAQGAAGLELAHWLERRPEVLQVLHPGLASHPDHALWRRDFSGACGVFAIVLKPQFAGGLAAMLDGYELFGLGYSWGGFESLASFAPPPLRAVPSPLDGPLVRFSIGLEDPSDLRTDLERGFERLREHA